MTTTTARDTGTGAVSPATAPGRVLTVMCAGMFLVLLDVTIVNVALPSIGHSLRAGVPTLQWVVDGYAVAIAGLLLAGGALGDHIGHRRLLTAGFAVFGVASAVCALAPTAAALIAGRVGQGVGGAMLLPSTMAVIVDVYPDRARQARALGTWAAVSSLALPAGPLLGGLLTGSVGWRLVFWINVPLIAVAIVAALLVVPASRPAGGRGRFDVAGVVGFVIGLSALVFTIVAGGHGAGAGTVATAAVVCVAALAGAVAVELRVAHPVLPVDLLRRRAFASPNVVAVLMNSTFNGTLFVTMLYLQDVRHFAPLTAGLTVLPLAAPLVFLAPVTGRLTARSGPRTSIALGCVLGIAGVLLLLGISTDGGLGWLLGGYLLLGCGGGLMTAAVVAAVVQAAPADRSGLATGMSNTARQIGTASGVAVFGAIAGIPSSAGFVGRLHVLAVVTAGMLVAALAVTLFGVEHRRDRPVR